MGRMVAARRAGGGLPLQCDGGFVLRLLCPLPTAPRGPLVARPLNDNMSDTPTVRSGCFFCRRFRETPAPQFAETYATRPTVIGCRPNAWSRFPRTVA